MVLNDDSTDKGVSIREALGDAIDRASTPSTGGGSAAPAPSATPPQKGGGAAPASAQPGGYLQPESPAGTVKSPANVPPSQQSVKTVGEKDTAGSPGEPADVPSAGLRAPSSWKPELREQFNTLPPTVQSEILRREKEISTTLQATVDARKHMERLQEVCAPYQHYIAMEGGDSMAAFGDYLRTVAVLRGGTPLEKAQALAAATHKFGVDVSQLDRALAAAFNGQPPPQQAQSPQEFRDPRLDGLLASLESANARRDEALSQSAASDIEAFASDAKNEFLSDVREDMADLLETAAKRGRVMSLEDAYNRACALNPEISKIIDQRRLAATANGQKQVIAGKRLAASSIRDTPARAVSPTGESMTVRAALEHAIASQTG